VSDAAPQQEPPTPSEDEAFVVAYATTRDLPAIYDIERRSFPAHWSYQTLADEVGRRRPYSHVLVGRLHDEVIAFTIVWIVADEAHILNFAVRPDHRRRGVGTRLLTALLERARSLRVRRVTLEVRVSNAGAIRLYERMGFRTVAIRRRFYQDNGEDAYVMWRDDLPGPAAGEDAAARRERRNPR
jgi:ribosomal-protein-alanine N-acetyltransferase